jgi:hypothetical protein
LVKVVPLSAPEAAHVKRVGFLLGEVRVPADFDRMGEEVIDALFSGQS